MTTLPLLTIENEFLRVEIATRGAELCFLFDKTHGFNALKRRDDPYWNGIAPILFPICGRLWKQTAYVNKKAYQMGTHGFASKEVFSVSKHEATRIALTLTDNDAIRSTCYPFRFLLTVEYILDGASLITRIRVENRDESSLPFSFGFHPGISLPLDEAGGIEDCYLDFPHAGETSIWQLSPRAFLTGKNDPYPLENGHRLSLGKDIFEYTDSLFFIGSGDTVTFSSSVSDRRIRIDYAGFPYLGLWTPNASNAGYLCIEPWIGSPDLDGRSTELSEKADMILLPPFESHSAEYRITIE